MEIIGLRSDEVVGTYNGTWDGCYERGYRPAKHPLPAIPMRAHIDDAFVEIAVLKPINEFGGILAWHASWYFDEEGSW